MNKNNKIDLIKEKVIYKRSVYNLVAKLKEDNLTENGYFDFEKVPGLRIVDNGIIKVLRKKYNKTQADFAKIVGVPLRTLIGWESYKKSIPMSKFMSLTKELGLTKEEFYHLIQECHFNVGYHHGGDRSKLPLEPNKFILGNYLIPNGNLKVYIVKEAPDEVKSFVIQNFLIDKHYYHKTGLIVVYSFVLNRFLHTFYFYEKVLNIKFPLSTEINFWRSKNVNLTTAVIIPFLLTDGGEKPGNRLYFSGASKALHNIWSDAWFYQYQILPSSYLGKYKSIFVTTYYVNRKVLHELKEICPNFKTSKGGQTEKDYLNTSQPSIKYLFNRPALEQQIAIRSWVNTEGSIMIRLNRKLKLITPTFQLACAHPALTNELKYLCNLHGINLSLIRDNKNWSGIGKLASTSIRSAINFLKIGGFIDGTKIAQKSEFFRGLDKQEVFLGILEFMLRQRHDVRLRLDDGKKIAKTIQKIVLNKEFKDKEAYLKIFSNFDNWKFRRN